MDELSNDKIDDDIRDYIELIGSKLIDLINYINKNEERSTIIKNIIINILDQVRFLFKDKNYEHEKEVRIVKRVNAFHSSLKRWIRKFNGVSTKFLTNYFFWYKWTQLFKRKMERNKLKKFFIHANSTHSISLIKDFKIKGLIYA